MSKERTTDAEDRMIAAIDAVHNELGRALAIMWWIYEQCELEHKGHGEGEENYYKNDVEGCKGCKAFRMLGEYLEPDAGWLKRGGGDEQ